MVSLHKSHDNHMIYLLLIAALLFHNGRRCYNFWKFIFKGKTSLLQNLMESKCKINTCITKQLVSIAFGIAFSSYSWITNSKIRVWISKIWDNISFSKLDHEYVHINYSIYTLKSMITEIIWTLYWPLPLSQTCLIMSQHSPSIIQ